MPKYLLMCLALALALAGCGVTPEAGKAKPAKTFSQDWPREGIRATIEYVTLQASQSKLVCAGRVSIENYGSKSYTQLYFKVSVFNASRELIATDKFLLVGSVNAGSRAEIPADRFNALDPLVITRSYSECPMEMDTATVQLEAS